MKVLLVTPPLVQMNTPYPAMPVLAGFLASRGVEVAQVDLSLALMLRLFSRRGLARVADTCRAKKRNPPCVRRFLEDADAYLSTVDTAVAFLQGRKPEAARAIAGRRFLPEGPRLAALTSGDGISPDEAFEMLTGGMGTTDRAKLLASLYLDDLAEVIREGVDPDFALARYAERLAVSMPTFTPLLAKLRAAPSPVAALLDDLAAAALRKHRPDVVGITLPFPGTVYAAFRIAAQVRRHRPHARVVMGGGYVNTELRGLSDPRVFGLVDDICFDEGFAPWLGILGLAPRVRTLSRGDIAARETPAVRVTSAPCAPPPHPLPPPSYAGLDFSRYVNMLETANPMHRLWSDGKWLKLPVANGCYWHRCAFCDVALDYIGRYAPPDVDALVATLVAMKRATGLSGFHFTDEALAPALLRRLSETLLARNLRIRWWGNVRFEKQFTPALARLMADAGCIAVTGGLECANDRLLALMNKGITLAGAEGACRAFAHAGIRVHAYLMYGFPTQTEADVLTALDYVRTRFAEGHIQSAFWHRFALTVHSPIARDPGAFGIRLLPRPHVRRRFALNEIPYDEPHAPDNERLGRGLRYALYNYMLGLGLERPVQTWFGKGTF